MKTTLKKLTSIKPTKRNLFIAGGILLAIIIIIILIVILKKPRQTFVDTENYFPMDSLTTQTITESDSDSTIVVNFPKTIKEEANIELSRQATEFAKKVNTLYAKGTLEYSAEPRVYDDYLFATISTQSPDIGAATPFKVLSLEKKEALDHASLFTDGYKGPIIASVSTSLSTTFQIQNELAAQLASQAIDNHDYRIAINGVVILVPTNKLGARAGTGSTYYEVLVPNNVVEKYMQD
jgi:hypothetical protein